MAKCMGELLNPVLPNFFAVAIEHLTYDDAMPTTLTVCNNACWFIGQVADSPANRSALLPYIS
jgi:hypothetical protein